MLQIRQFQCGSDLRRFWAITRGWELPAIERGGRDRERIAVEGIHDFGAILKVISFRPRKRRCLSGEHVSVFKHDYYQL